jgi:hypothetical protein
MTIALVSTAKQPLEAPARSGPRKRDPAERLRELREAAASCEALDVLLGHISDMKKAVSNVDPSSTPALFDDFTDAITRSQQRAGKLLLLSGAQGTDLSTTLINRYTRWASMNESEFAKQREIARDEARQRRQTGGAVPIQIARTRITPWILTHDQCWTRWVYGVAPDDVDPQSTGRRLMADEAIEPEAKRLLGVTR